MKKFALTGSLAIKAVNPIEVVNAHLASEKIVALASDSRGVSQVGSLFAAVSLSKDQVEERRWYRVYKPTPTHFFDSHPYIYDAIERGARFVLCEKPPQDLRSDVMYIVVPNVIAALGQMAKYVIELTNTKVVAITGSSGKTTTTQAIYSVLNHGVPNVGKVYTYRPTPISLPVSILNLYCTKLGFDSCLVLEMPTDHFGCITSLANITKPNVGVVLNVIDAHIHAFGSAEGIAKAKSEMVTSTTKDGSVILNYDDKRVKNMETLAGKRMVVSFGVSDKATIFGKVLHLNLTNTIFEVTVGADTKQMVVPLIGPSSIYIALAAIAVGLAFGMSLSEIAVALSDFDLMPGRMSWKFCDNGRIVVFDNSAKTNTTNLRHLLSAITTANWYGEKILVLGQFDFHEHPDLEPEAWNTIGSFFDHVILVGTDSHVYKDKIKGLSGSSVSNVYLAETNDKGADITIKLLNQTSSKCYLVVTGHEFVELDKLVERVVQSYE